MEELGITYLLDLPEVLLAHVGSFLVPDWHTLGVELDKRIRAGQKPSDPKSRLVVRELDTAPLKASLADLVSFNLTCKKVHVTTDALLFRNVTWSSTYSTIWYFLDSVNDPTSPIAIKRTNAMLSRFSHSRIAILHMPKDTNAGFAGDNVVMSLRIVMPHARATDDWLWTSTRVCPDSIHRLHLRCWSADTKAPQWLGPQHARSWRVQYREPLEDLLVPPGILALPVEGTCDGMLMVTWGVKGGKGIDVMVRDLEAQISDWPKLAKPLEWRSLTLRAVGDLPNRAEGTKLVKLLQRRMTDNIRVWAEVRLPHTHVKLAVYDKGCGRELGAVECAPSRVHPQIAKKRSERGGRGF